MKLGINVKHKPDTYIIFPQKDFLGGGGQGQASPNRMAVWPSGNLASKVIGWSIRTVSFSHKDTTKTQKCTENRNILI